VEPVFERGSDRLHARNRAVGGTSGASGTCCVHVIKVGVPVSNLANSGSRFFVCGMLARRSSARRLKRRTRAEFDIAVAIVARCRDQYVTLLPPNALLMQLCINPASLPFILTLYSRDALRSSGLRSTAIRLS
jgi:hypothetical protein